MCNFDSRISPAGFLRQSYRRLQGWADSKEKDPQSFYCLQSKSYLFQYYGNVSSKFANKIINNELLAPFEDASWRFMLKARAPRAVHGCVFNIAKVLSAKKLFFCCEKILNSVSTIFSRPFLLWAFPTFSLFHCVHLLTSLQKKIVKFWYIKRVSILKSFLTWYLTSFFGGQSLFFIPDYIF